MRFGLLTLAVFAAPALATGPSQALSPDGRTQAIIVTERGEVGASGNPPSSLWVARADGSGRRLLFRGHSSSAARQDTASLANPRWSLDGGYIYVEADAYATSPAIHQVALATGRERFVVDGGLIGVLRTGPWRGFLVVQQHRYHPGGGSYDPVLVYRPDGRQIAEVPGSAADEGHPSVDRWLSAHGWTMS